MYSSFMSKNFKLLRYNMAKYIQVWYTEQKKKKEQNFQC